MKDQWILVQNPGELPIWGIRLLGLSTKSSDKIGKFGTGLKETIALVFRLGSELVIYSGVNKYVFSVMKQDGQDEIGFVLNDEAWRGMGLSPDFGKHDWNSAWQVLREVFCNAIDEGLDTLYYDMVTEAIGVEGSTRVYIKVNNQLKNAFYTIDRKLLMLGDIKPIHEGEAGDIYDKIGIGDGMQVYHKKVWITQCGLSLFDYSLHNLEITESRTAAEGDCLGQLRDIIAPAPLFILKRIFRAVSDAIPNEEEPGKIPIEVSHVNTSSYHSFSYSTMGKKIKKNWTNAWYDEHGEGAVAIRSNGREFELVREMGKVPVICPNYWIDVFRVMGVPTYATVVHEDKQEGREITGQIRGHRVWDQLEKAGLTDGRIPPVMYKFIGETGRPMFVREKMIYINEERLGGDHEDQLMLEGMCYYLAGAERMTLKLESYLYTAVLKLMEKS